MSPSTFDGLERKPQSGLGSQDYHPRTKFWFLMDCSADNVCLLYLTLAPSETGAEQRGVCGECHCSGGRILAQSYNPARQRHISLLTERIMATHSRYPRCDIEKENAEEERILK